MQPNGPHSPLGGCGVRAFASELTPMRVKKLEKYADYHLSVAKSAAIWVRWRYLFATSYSFF